MPEKGTRPAKTPPAKTKEKQARLANALRKNLHRRKARGHDKTQKSSENGDKEERDNAENKD